MLRSSKIAGLYSMIQRVRRTNEVINLSNVTNHYKVIMIQIQIFSYKVSDF